MDPQMAVPMVSEKVKTSVLHLVSDLACKKVYRLVH